MKFTLVRSSVACALACSVAACAADPAPPPAGGPQDATGAAPDGANVAFPKEKSIHDVLALNLGFARRELGRALEGTGLDQPFAFEGRTVTMPRDVRVVAAFRTVPAQRDGKTFKAAQIYTCQADASGALSFGPASAPDAGLAPLGPFLTSDGALGSLLPFRATHFRFPGDAAAGIPAGPTWRVESDLHEVVPGQLGDAFGAPPRAAVQFVGALDVAAPARPGSIADLRVRNVGGIREPAGQAVPLTVRAINEADFVLRLRTRGGLRPTGPCSFVGEQVRSPYFAEYYFVSVI
ncbi:MAG TPA: DUF3455 domain-containing protein [Polyangiaceae bacterium]|nr:DUF3455 domain-containing protein [Polyangiaceae bacterium]